MPNSHDRVTQETFARVFVVGLDPIAHHHQANRLNDLLSHLVFDQAFIGGNDAMRTLCIHATEDLTLLASVLDISLARSLFLRMLRIFSMRF